MKRYSFLAAMIFPILVLAQNPDYKVVFDLTSMDTLNHQSLLRQITFIKKANPNAQLEVVVYSKGVDFVINKNTPQQATLQQLIDGKSTRVKVCEASLKRLNLDKSQLVPGVEVVPDGIYEIITKQKEGWGYIKVSN